MNNLFSTFDPSSWYSLNLNWAAFIVPIFTLPILCNGMSTQMTHNTNKILTSVMSELYMVAAKTASPGIMKVPIVLLMFIGCTNFLGLTPFTFTSSAHLTFSVAMALPLWLGHIILKISSQPLPVLSHLVPLGTPVPLMPFMVLIELTSSIIRPLTLSVRLTANMIAGHLLISLIGHAASPTSHNLLLGIIVVMLALCVLETAVSLIQAYVFSMLSTLYVNEVDSPRMTK